MEERRRKYEELRQEFGQPEDEEMGEPAEKVPANGWEWGWY